ncbi:hypothetical protein HAX54_040438 [Datura stramonium]|uniref:Ubiquitin-like protease family profile domain-containing protein n=1 Tax=Datura stramonium TaxID=4076 RepID=A0ABS8VP62_DATST|nr:hypothetical protein [Datura stramonium]
MEDGIDADVLMDYVEFQIFPSQNRYESHICYGNKLETAASGLLEQLILHSPKIKSLHSKGSDANFRFKPLGNLSDAKWFTKSTLIRFLRIISSSSIIDMAKAMVNEISQLEEARKFHVSLYSKGPQDCIGSGEAECDYSSGAVSSSQQADDNPSSDASKNELLRAMDLRLTALKGELAAAFDQAAGTTCSFEDIINIEKFSYYFGAVEFRNCLQKFIALSEENKASSFPGKELSLSKVDVRNDKVGSEGGNSQTSGPSKLDTPVKYSASPAKAAQIERQNSSGSDESSCTSEEEQPSVERSRTLIRSASPRRSASPMRRVQIGRSGSRRSTALTIKSLNYYPARERSISHKDAAASGSDEEDSEQASKEAEKDACRMSVQDAINLFESKQKGPAVDYQRTKSLLSASVGANKVVLRRWSSGVCEGSKGSIDVVSDDPVSEAMNKLEDQETESTLEMKPDSYSPLKSHDVEAAAADIKQNLPEDEAYCPNVKREESLPNQGEEIGEKLNASVEWTRQKEAELNQLLTKMMETKPSKYRNLAASDSKNQSRSTERRGGLYDHYKEKRDEKLRGETARNRAEKYKQFKAMQQILDERKAEIVAGNANNISKRTNIKRTQRPVKKSPESANTKDGAPKTAVAKKASSKASQLPATRKSWPSLPSPRVAGTSTAKTPHITNSAGTTPTRRRSQPTSVSQTSQKVEKLQPQAKSVKTPQNNIRKNVANGNDKKQQTLTKASKPTKTRVQPTPGDSAFSAKPRLSKVTKKSSVVPLESKEAKPFLRKGSGTGSGHSPVIKAKVSSQPEKSLRESTDFAQVEENEMVTVASSPLNQLQSRGLEELTIQEDEDSAIKLNSPQKYEDRESCNKVMPDNEDDFGRMEESALKREVEEESNISPSAWVVIEEQEDQALPCNDGFGPNESLADVATARISSPRVRHSLSQMLLEESSEDVIDWGNAENPPTMVYQKDVPKGLKRLLKFARKSKTDSNSTGVSSPSVFSEGEDDPEDSKLLTKSSSDNLLKKATLHAKHSGQPKSSSEEYELSAQTSIGKIAAQKLQASRLSAPASITKVALAQSSPMVVEKDQGSRTMKRKEYFGSDNTRTVSKAELVEKFEKKVWLYDRCSQVDLKVATKIENRIPKLLNWKTNDNHPCYENLMQEMFSIVNNPLIFRNIVPNPRELLILELPQTFVESHSVYLVANEANHSDDDFMEVQLKFQMLKGKKVGDSSSPVKKKTKQQSAASPHSIRRQLRHVIKPSVKKMPSIQPLRKKSVSPKEEAVVTQAVKDEFDDIRRLINEKFNSVMDAVRVGHEAEGLGDQTDEIHHHTCLGLDHQQLRKKYKYNPVNTYKYTTVDYPFKKIIAWIWDKSAEADSVSSAAKEEDLICEYINGYRFYAAIPWYTVDNVFIPINVKDKIHWVLAILLFRNRCIYVYDSLGSVEHDVAVKREIDKLSQLLPIHVLTTDFYHKKGITTSTHPRYNIQIPSDAFEGLWSFCPAYAEFLSSSEDIPNSSIDVDLLQNRYASILWDYAMKKIEAESMSDDEAPLRKIRPIVDSTSSYRIKLS